jgi:hypothetical protein
VKTEIKTQDTCPELRNPFLSLNASGLKDAFKQRDASLRKVLVGVAVEWEKLTPLISEIQALLSQRGKDRKKVMKAAGLPTWTAYAKEIETEFDVSFRTISRHIKLFRCGGKKSMGKKTNPFRLDRKTAEAIIRQAVAANDFALAVERGGDWHTPLAEFKKVRLSSEKLQAIEEAAAAQPDLRKLLLDMVVAVGHMENIPINVQGALTAARRALNPKKFEKAVAKVAAAA